MKIIPESLAGSGFFVYFCRNDKNDIVMADKQTDNIGSGLLTPPERYINPYTDFGFKKLFGTEMNKDLLINFLNALPSMGSRQIADVEYMNSEHLGDGYGDRRAVFEDHRGTDPL